MTFLSVVTQNYQIFETIFSDTKLDQTKPKRIDPKISDGNTRMYSVRVISPGPHLHCSFFFDFLSKWKINRISAYRTIPSQCDVLLF